MFFNSSRFFSSRNNTRFFLLCSSGFLIHSSRVSCFFLGRRARRPSAQFPGCGGSFWGVWSRVTVSGPPCLKTLGPGPPCSRPPSATPPNPGSSLPGQRFPWTVLSWTALSKSAPGFLLLGVSRRTVLAWTALSPGPSGTGPSFGLLGLQKPPKFHEKTSRDGNTEWNVVPVVWCCLFVVVVVGCWLLVVVFLGFLTRDAKMRGK